MRINSPCPTSSPVRIAFAAILCAGPLLVPAPIAAQWSQNPPATPQPVSGLAPADVYPETAEYRLPIAPPPISSAPIIDAGYPTQLSEPIVDDVLDSIVKGKPSDRKPGSFQRISLTTTWIPTSRVGDLGISDVDVWATFGLPAPTPDSPLLITPGFTVYYLDGPVTPDLPERIYDVTTQFRWLSKFGDRFAVDLSVTPGLYTDFERNQSDAFRIPSRALGVWESSPSVKWVAGVLYLDRSDINWLPAGGLMWTINEDTQLDALFPKPKFARRFYVDCWTEYWWYLAGEFGGDSYFIERASGATDTITLRDYRLLYGVERRKPGGVKGRVEVGYVFGRTVEYDSGTPDFDAEDAFLLRGGISY